MALGNLAIKTEKANSYDRVPYQSFSYPQTHPEHLFTIGRLFGLNPPDFRTARILELGCASGGNILPLAALYPDCEITGIDLSGEQIDQAMRHTEQLGLANIRFRQMDILDVTAELGTFDYIIAHGILSWVPDLVGGKVLDILHDNLAENGLAVASYNTLPGWNFVKSLREMMMYHTAGFPDPAEKIRQARALLDFLAENARNEAYRQFIEGERQLLAKTNDSYLFHDHMEATNRQFYFHEIAEMAGERGLQYVGDASLSSMFVGNLPKAAMEKLGSIGNIVRQEQYMDFISNRRFRTTILAKTGSKLIRSLNKEQIFDFTLSANIKNDDHAAEVQDKMSFACNSGSARFTARNKETSALTLAMASMTRRFTMNEAIDAAESAYKIPKTALRSAAFDCGLQLVMSGILNIHSAPDRAARAVGPRPEAFALARYQAGIPGTTMLTNVNGESVGTDVFANHLLSCMDGTNDLAAIAAIIAARAKAGDLEVRKGGKPVRDEATLRDILKPAMDRHLAAIAANGLLVA